MNTLANKTALVTGASRGMGRATALALAAEGARVIVHYGRNADEANAVVNQIRAKGGQADAVSADLAAPDGAHMLAAQVRNLAGGKLDILVSNAGISNATTIRDPIGEGFRRAVRGQCPRAVLPGAAIAADHGEHGSIVFVSSLGARAAVGTLAAYASTKGAINTLVKYLACALGARGIRVNAVAPGVIDTDMSNFTKTEAGRTTVMGMQSLKRIGQPDDVASVVSNFSLPTRRAGSPATSSPSMAAQSSEPPAVRKPFQNIDGANHEPLHNMQPATAAADAVQRDDHRRRSHHRHDLFRKRRGADAAVSPVPGKLRAHAFRHDDRLRRVCIEPAGGAADGRLAFGLYRTPARPFSRR